ncbi:hypothetical protein DQP55_04065 [Mycolicibacterium sp. GF69]|uniref:hypothetical protein n=1 Tax=Mycolicibacterium sp. GF69 TaxID=2267251 RepID=UPI000DCE44E0|nr:hypothetical protein [Mycolicibacterium sp. GF69]RAV17172.1 hypothetical protein DQP55_04065 [Mycolicibacterium sp. GF69]
MAEPFDAATRLAEGSAAVADVEQYVLACRCLGYQHPGLTTHPAQIRDGYATEAGMDLGALQADCAALQAAAVAAEDALARQDGQLDMLATAWQGGGANASREFLRRHGEAVTLAATAVRTAANTLADLRDRLWQAVDGKVASVLRIGEGVQARRGDWLAAAHTVTTGAGDRATASELIDQEVKPFLDNVIGGQWLAAMRTAVDAVEAAYEAATAELTAQAGVTFDVPRDLGPAWTPSGDGATTTPAGTFAVAPAAVAPSNWGGMPAAAPPTATPFFAAAPPSTPFPGAAPGPAAPPTPLAAPLPTDPAMAQPMAAPSLPSLGGGLPDIGSGLTSFGQQLGDMLGGLLGGDSLLDPVEADDPLDTADIAEPATDEESEPDEGEIDEADEVEPEADDVETAADEAIDDSVSAEEGSVEPLASAAAPVCPPEPAPETASDEPGGETSSAPPPEPLGVVPGPPPEGSGAGTPCEIAADELPQVGE